MKIVKAQDFSVLTIEGENKGSVELAAYLKSKNIEWRKVTSWKYENGTWIVVIKSLGYEAKDGIDIDISGVLISPGAVEGKSNG